MGAHQVQALLPAVRKEITFAIAKEQWNSLQKYNTGKQKRTTWIPCGSKRKYRPPLQSDILFFLSILHVSSSAPEIAIQVDNTTGVTSQLIYVEWKVCFCQK